MNILGIIPARSGSKGIKDKNIYPCAGGKLMDWTIRSAMHSKLNSVCISTNIDDILKEYNFAFKRPDYLCKDDTPMIEAVRYSMYYCMTHNVNIDTIMLLQPTSPLRTTEDINNAIETFNNSDTNSLYSGYYIGIKNRDNIYDKHTAQKHFQRNGAIFIAKRELIEQGKLWDDTVIEYEMPLSRSIDIDDIDDMMIAEALLKYRDRSDNI